MSDRRRDLPSIERLLQEPAVAALLASAPRSAVLAAARDAVSAARTGRAGVPADWGIEIAERLQERSASSLRRVLNATGVVLHTNLGRAPLAAAAIRAIERVAAGYSSLELDLPSGSRGDRGDHARRRLARLAGAGDALAVNNAAGALVLVLNTVADGAPVAISRGELIEIGGSFRIPEILAKSGARLHEVGTTNRTHLDDYRRALDAGAACFLVVHRSNFSQRGFVSSPDPAEVGALAREAGIPFVYDIGSGLLADLAPFGLSGEPSVRDAVGAGATVALFSGDKLLGGPQAGIMVGAKATIASCRRNPFARALRADKMTLAALDATLALYEDPDLALSEVPVLRMLTATPASLADRARALRDLCPPAASAELVTGASAVGGGAFPDASLPTTLVAIAPGGPGAESLALRLRLGDPALVARVAGGRLLLDPRTLPDDSFSEIARLITRALDDA